MLTIKKKVNEHTFIKKNKWGQNYLTTEFVKRFHQEVILIPDMEDRLTYTSFPNGLRNGQFKFSLAKQMETYLAKALQKVMDFIGAIKICIESGDGLRKNWPKERNLTRAKQRQRNESQDQCFT